MNEAPHDAGLTEAQQRRISATCLYIDQLLSEIEHALTSSDSASPFTKYIPDLSADQAGVIEAHIRRLRSQLLRSLESLGMKPPPPKIPVSRSIISDLNFVDIALEELNPRYMRGSGEVSEETAHELSEFVRQLRSLVRDMISDVEITRRARQGRV